MKKFLLTVMLVLANGCATGLPDRAETLTPVTGAAEENLGLSTRVRKIYPGPSESTVVDSGSVAQKIYYHLEVIKRKPISYLEDKRFRNKLESPLVLKPEKKNQLIFYIGPEQADAGRLPKSDPSLKYQLKISMNCSFNRKNTADEKRPDTQMITFDPKTGESSKAIFTIWTVIRSWTKIT